MTGSRRVRPLALGATIAAALATVFLIARVPMQASKAPHPPAPHNRDRLRIRYPVGHYPTLALPNGDVRVVRSVLAVDHTMRFGDYQWDETGVEKGPVWVRVDLARQMLSVFRAGHEIGTAVILYGTDGKPTPTGMFPILAREKDHRSSLYDADMPYMLRLTGDGVAIHASHVRQGFATHGCIGVPLAFAQRLYDAVHVGDEVAIMPPRT